MIGSNKLIYQVAPTTVFLGAVGVASVFGLGATYLDNEYFGIAATLGLASNVVLGVLVKSGRDHAAVAAIALAIGFWSWTGLNRTYSPAPPPQPEFIGCNLTF